MVDLVLWVFFAVVMVCLPMVDEEIRNRRFADPFIQRKGVARQTNLVVNLPMVLFVICTIAILLKYGV